MKKLIICIIGESGSGKTTLAEELRLKYGIKLIESYTDRPKRTPDEIGHTFLSVDEFDLLKREDMIAYTKFGDYRYCCLFSDLEQVNTYVIDETGFMMLKRLKQDEYCVRSIRITCSTAERIRRVGKERVARDRGRFKIPFTEFDIVYSTDLHKSIFECGKRVKVIEGWINSTRAESKGNF